MTSILRSHEVRQGRKVNTRRDSLDSSLCRLDGYAVEHNGLCTTVTQWLFRVRSSFLIPFQVFSAPNYVDQGRNKGAFVRPLAALRIMAYNVALC